VQNLSVEVQDLRARVQALSRQNRFNYELIVAAFASL